MRRPKTDLTGWSQEEIRDHKNRQAREDRALNPEKDRARTRKYYAKHSAEVIARQKSRNHANPEPRRATVRASRHRDPVRVLLESAERRARAKNIPFTLTREWADKHYKGKCELTGLEFTTHGRLTGKVSPFAPSIDQIVPGVGYTPANAHFVLWAINRFKGDMPIMTMMVIARALVARQP
jgi:hypothetical protein